jgi:type II secretory pathway component PulF
VGLRALVALSEPVLILVMGGIVAFVVMSMLVAVYAMTDLIH